MELNSTFRQRFGLFSGIFIFIIILILPETDSISSSVKNTAAITILMAIFWITEAIPIPATALFPIALFPMLGIMNVSMATEPYAHHLIFLFMGGFLIAVTMEKWNLHKRIALNIIKIIGNSPEKIILGFMTATAVLSMWISNTATAMMMVPIGIAIIKQSEYKSEKNHFGIALMIGIAYSASIGGIATIIGTPPNTVFVAVANEILDININFIEWMKFGLPVSVVMLVIAYFYLIKIAFPIKNQELSGGDEIIHDHIKKLGKIKKEEILILIVFLFTAFLWILFGLSKTISFLGFLSDIFPKYNDSVVAIIGAILLFIIPSDFKKGKFLLDWETAKKIPWGIIILFGGGLSLAAGFVESGLAEWITTNLETISNINLFVMILIISGVTIFLTEVSSNTATCTLLMPLLAVHAIAISINPLIFMVSGAVASSMAFMLPVATPPNAVVFGSGYVNIPQMAKAGLWLNILAVIVISVAVYFLLPVVWNLP